LNPRPAKLQDMRTLGDRRRLDHTIALTRLLGFCLSSEKQDRRERISHIWRETRKLKLSLQNLLTNVVRSFVFEISLLFDPPDHRLDLRRVDGACEANQEKVSRLISFLQLNGHAFAFQWLNRRHYSVKPRCETRHGNRCR